MGRCPEVLGLYLERPLLALEVAQVWVGRFRYSDLKEAALSGASGLWELNRLELLVVASGGEVLVWRVLVSYVLMTVHELRDVA